MERNCLICTMYYKFLLPTNSDMLKYVDKISIYSRKLCLTC
uniref:Uncharacterized protein n=1 Tax=Rhizophora mucronata TaxID=61149 RepID=A0A2P2NHD1_RHIMU